MAQFNFKTKRTYSYLTKPREYVFKATVRSYTFYKRISKPGSIIRNGHYGHRSS